MHLESSELFRRHCHLEAPKPSMVGVWNERDKASFVTRLKFLNKDVVPEPEKLN